ncbi:MAG: hypothetical protein COU31_04545 [Candidatus Magasanikbacteria bacterium CG10_big_fil_rev_8_21_14_0_10_40_10]|uniref:Protein kinase domain-containing protein n=1 Tax=Candidatus Magasanikbacteria bacterium CG10_big_fil_rev_8_21_14_0_10_40_10 TaxID=1974648 RepID=A0A2M6W326_9BACT|nr:MAG: hypothetical protein COU31_04545 [Candidatus Magasanikbacteria bacterium CG10_big_fil_rev_8_21_14_0_10_40_10]
MINTDKIQLNWPLTNVQIKGILQKKGERVVYDIASDNGSFIMKVADESKTKNELAKELEIFDFLNANNFSNIPKLLKTITGKNFIEDEGKFLIMMEKVEGIHPEPNPKTYAKLGKLVARLHSVKLYPHKTSFTFASELPKLKENIKKFPFGQEYKKLVDSVPNFDLFSHSLIHTDIAPLNVIEKKNSDIIILDWDDAGIGVSLFDLGFSLIQQFVWEDKEFFDEDSAKSFYSSYFSLRSLPEGEKEQIFQAGLFYALMYLPYENYDKAWKRIKFALDNREKIVSSIY